MNSSHRNDEKPADKYSIIVSQIGYRPDDHKVAVLRCDDSDAGDIEEFQLVKLNGAIDPSSVYRGRNVTAWGEKWGVHFWILDFSDFQETGDYSLQIPSFQIRSSAFAIKPALFLEETFIKTSVAQLDAKVGDKMGWQDCGSDLRAVEGHAVQLLGLLDCYESFEEKLSEAERERLRAHIRRGAGYLVECQRDDGSFMNEFYIARDKTNWSLCMLAAVALSRAYEMSDTITYLNAAKKGWDWCLARTEYSPAELAAEVEETRKIYGKYKPWYPPKDLRTRDQLLLVWAGTELYKNTNDIKYKNAALDFAREIGDKLQFLDYAESENGVYGNFFAWESDDVYQKSWEHVGWGYNCGAILPDEVSGFINLVSLFPDEDDWLKWRYALRQYAYGYLKATAGLSPFGIYPLGMFDGEIRFFGPSWHGFNAVYGRIARTAMLLARLFSEPAFEIIANQNMQWLAGLNVGVKTEAGHFEGLSWICGIGSQAVKPWTNIPGSICNGFCANPQFKMKHLDDLADKPKHVNTEDWIVHNGGWLSGLSEIEKEATLKIRTQYQGRPVPAAIRLSLPEEHEYATPRKGVLFIDKLPVLRHAALELTWNGICITHDYQTISGQNYILVVDFSDHLAAGIVIDCPRQECCLTVTNHGMDSAAVKAQLRAIGAVLAEQQFSGTIAPGQTHQFGCGYHLDPAKKRQPVYVYAEIVSKYSSAVCEADWKP